MVLNKYFENIFTGKVSYFLERLKNILLNKNFIIFLIAFFVSAQGFISGTFPFSYALLGVASLFDVPLIIVFIPALISMIIAKIASLTILKFFIFFVIFTALTAIVNIEGINKKYVVMIKLLMALIISNVLILFISNSNIGFSTTIFEIILAMSFYIIFTYGSYVLINLNKDFIFTKEEYLALAATLAVIFGIFKNCNIYNFSIINVLSIILILIVGWKNGAVSGCTTGLIVSLIISIITKTEDLSYIISVAFAGLISGLLSKHGKIGAILGFIFGELIINYWLNGFSELSLRFSEMLVASLSLLLVSKKAEDKIENIFNKNRTIKRPYDEILDYGSDVKNRLNAVSEVFDDLASVTVPLTQEDNIETRNVIKKYIVDYVNNNCFDYNKKEKLIGDEKLDIMVDYISTKLENNEEISSEMLDFEDIDFTKIVKDLKEVYNSMKFMRLMKKKENENSKKVSKQYKEVAKIISSISKDIVQPSIITSKIQDKIKNELKFFGYVVYEDLYNEKDGCIEYTFVTDILTDIDKQEKQITKIVSDILEQNMVVKLILNSSKNEKSKIKLVSKTKYDVEVGIASLNKQGEDISGDSYLSMEMQDFKHLCVISDGAASGIQAAKNSKAVINMLEKLLNGGFDKSKAIEIINNVIKLKDGENRFSTIDISIIDLNNAESEYIKLGAAPTYILDDGKIISIKNTNIPVGLIDETEYIPIVKKLKNNDIVIQISDGVVTDDMQVDDNYFIDYIKKIDVNKSARNLADEISNEIQKQSNNILKDDATVIVTKIKENVVD